MRTPLLLAVGAVAVSASLAGAQPISSSTVAGAPAGQQPGAGQPAAPPAQPAAQPDTPTGQPAATPAAPPAAPTAGPPAGQPTASPPASAEPVQSFGDEPAAPAGHTAPDSYADPDADGDPTSDHTPQDIQTFADATLDARRLRFALNAFGDASFLGRAPSEGEDTATFTLGTLALLINGQLGESLLGTAEVAFDANRDNQQAVKLERLSVRWQRPRYFLVGGRTHTDLGYWNTAFHHGAWLHLPIRRPRALRGETSGGILPIHWIGVEGGVMLPTGPGTLTVGGGVGNGRGHDEGDIRLNNDSNRFKAVRVKVEYLGLLPDLRVGVGGLYDRIAPEDAAVRPALPDERIDEYIGNAYSAYRGAELTLIAEAYGIWHRANGDTFTTTDGFVVAGYRFGRVTPYVQVERVDARGGVDPFYTPMPDTPTPSTPADQTEVLVGTRFDTSVWSALKLEYSALRLDTRDAIDHSLMLNWSFGI